MASKVKTQHDFAVKPFTFNRLPGLPDDIPATRKMIHTDKSILPSSLELPDISGNMGNLKFDLPEPVPRMGAPKLVPKVEVKHHKKGLLSSFKKMLHIGS